MWVWGQAWGWGKGQRVIHLGECRYTAKLVYNAPAALRSAHQLQVETKRRHRRNRRRRIGGGGGEQVTLGRVGDDGGLA